MSEGEQMFVFGPGFTKLDSPFSVYQFWRENENSGAIVRL